MANIVGAAEYGSLLRLVQDVKSAESISAPSARWCDQDARTFRDKVSGSSTVGPGLAPAISQLDGGDVPNQVRVRSSRIWPLGSQK